MTKIPQDGSLELRAIPGELRATIHVTRKATGKVDTYQIVGHPDPEKLAQLVGAARHNRVHGAAGSLAGEGAQLSDTSQPPKER